MLNLMSYIFLGLVHLDEFNHYSDIYINHKFDLSYFLSFLWEGGRLDSQGSAYP